MDNYTIIILGRCRPKIISESVLLNAPSVDPLPKWNLWSDLNSVKAITVGILHSDSQLDTENLAAILCARDPSAYGTMSGQDVESIFSWLVNNPDAPDNPYKLIFNRSNKENVAGAPMNVYACMRASVELGLLETEGGILGATERACERMDALKCAAKMCKVVDATMTEKMKQMPFHVWMEKYEEAKNLLVEIVREEGYGVEQQEHLAAESDETVKQAMETENRE